jgi:hypothetical protein
MDDCRKIQARLPVSPATPYYEPAMLTLRFKKTLDADATLTLVRPDGSTAWAPIGSVEGFGPMNDLAHVVVERQLMLFDAFLARVARGASFADFGEGAAARIGPDAIRAEAVANLLSLETITGRRLTLAAFNDAVREKCSAMRPGYHAPDLTPSGLHGLRSELAFLRREWEALDPGATLELQFGREDPTAASSERASSAARR